MPVAGTSRSGQTQSRWLTLGQACRVLGVDESTLRRWADSGQVQAYRTPGGHRRFSETDLRDLLSGRAQDGQQYQKLGDLAISRIRRQLHRAPAKEAPWHATVDERSRERLRPLGRRLAGMAADFLGRRNRRAGLLEDARELGREYGRELASAGLPLARAMEAFIFFRRSLDEATKKASQSHGLSPQEGLAACEQVAALGDQVLVGLSEAYDSARAAGGELSGL